MRVEAEDFFAQIVVEPAHHADDDDEHGHAERDADDGDERDDGDKRPFGPQITQREQQFKRQSRHGGRLKTGATRVNEAREAHGRTLRGGRNGLPWLTAIGRPRHETAG